MGVDKHAPGCICCGGGTSYVPYPGGGCGCTLVPSVLTATNTGGTGITNPNATFTYGPVPANLVGLSANSPNGWFAPIVPGGFFGADYQYEFFCLTNLYIITAYDNLSGGVWSATGNVWQWTFSSGTHNCSPFLFSPGIGIGIAAGSPGIGTISG